MLVRPIDYEHSGGTPTNSTLPASPSFASPTTIRPRQRAAGPRLGSYSLLDTPDGRANLGGVGDQRIGLRDRDLFAALRPHVVDEVLKLGARAGRVAQVEQA